MTVDTRTRPTHTWTPRVTVQLTVLAAAAFVYVTAEMVPVAALPAIAADFRVSEALVGTLLAAFGIAGLVSMGVMARPLDRRPHASAVSCLAALATAFAVLTSLAFDRGAGLVALLVGVGAIVLWGASSTALPPMLQAAAMRTAPEDPDGASGWP